MSTSRPACAAVGALLVTLALAGCGGSSSSTDTNAGASGGAGTAQTGGARRGFLQDPKVVACLKKEGVTVPSRPRGANGGQPGAQNRRPGSAQFQKLRAALQKCGVDFPGPAPNGQPPQGQGTATTTAS